MQVYRASTVHAPNARVNESRVPVFGREEARPAELRSESTREGLSVRPIVRALARSDAFTTLFVFAASFATFAASLYPRVGGRFQFGDAAKWQWIGHVLGVPHPPGSPLYVLTSHVFSHLPLPVSVGTRVELLSALCGAAACALLFTCARRLGLSKLGAVLASVGFATTEAMWTFSTEAEVYAPLGLLAVIVLHRSLVWLDARRDRDLAVVMFAFALGVGVHYAIVTLAPATIVLVWCVERRTFVRARPWLLAMLAISVGALPFVWLWHHAPHAPYSELGARSWRSFVDFLLVRQYRDDLSTFSLATLWFDRSGFAVSTLCRSASWVVLVAAPFGIARLSKHHVRVGAWLSLAALVPLSLIALHDAGDERGELLPALPSVMLSFAAAWDGPRRARAAGFAVVLVTASLTGLRLAKAAAQDPMQRDTDEIHDYPFDLSCVLDGASPGAVIVPPHADYGARQIASYYRFTDPRAHAFTFAWLERPVAEWKWAPPEFRPAIDDMRPVYVFRRDHARSLAAKGYQSRELRYAELGCSAHGNTVLFRMQRRSSGAQTTAP